MLESIPDKGFTSFEHSSFNPLSIAKLFAQNLHKLTVLIDPTPKATKSKDLNTLHLVPLSKVE